MEPCANLKSGQIKFMGFGTKVLNFNDNLQNFENYFETKKNLKSE